MKDKFYEKTLAAERKYTGKIMSVDLLDIELPCATSRSIDSSSEF